MMTCYEKLSMLKTLLKIEDNTLDDTLTVYLQLAQHEILSWMYTHYADIPENAEMPSKYDGIQIQAVIAGYNLQGGENQFKHSENGVVREWHYSDMVEYIHAHVIQKLVI